MPPVKKKVAQKKSVKKVVKKQVTEREPAYVIHPSNSKGKTFETPPTTHVSQSTSSVSDFKIDEWLGLSREADLKSDKNRIALLEKSVSLLTSQLEKLRLNRGEDSCLWLPISLTVLNASRHTAKDVKLFDYNYKSQNTIIYESMQSHISYDDLLRYKDASNNEIGMIRLNLEGTKSGYVQLFATDEQQTGIVCTSPVPMILDPYQHQSYILQKRINLFHNANSNIIIDSIEPMTRITFHLFIDPATKKTRKTRK